jgi:HSP90 family molecular chaperone
VLPEGGEVENPSVTLLYSDEKFEVWIDTEKDNITLSMADRGITLLFTRDEWLEFQEVIGNIALEGEEEEEEEEPEET